MRKARQDEFTVEKLVQDTAAPDFVGTGCPGLGRPSGRPYGMMGEVAHAAGAGTALRSKNQVGASYTGGVGSALSVGWEGKTDIPA
jgi:hypothetical protein